jgi:spermidine/putrescine transport system permease protein
MSETVRKKGITGYFLLGPGMLWLLLFFLIPFYSLLAASLFNSGGSDFRGYTMVYEWSNYTEVIKAYWPQIVR